MIRKTYISFGKKENTSDGPSVRSTRRSEDSRKQPHQFEKAKHFFE